MFARQVNVPGFYSWGYNDMTCPPTTTFAAYNVITAPKTLLLAEETAHWNYPEQTEASWQWIMQQFRTNVVGEQECAPTRFNSKVLPLEEQRRRMESANQSNPSVAPIAPGAVETFTWNSKTFPIIGYGRQENDKIFMFVPIEYAESFLTSYCSGYVSRSISGELTINGGQYAGNHHVYYMVINDQWWVPRLNIYLDTPWKI
jgi:hypothetical protein